MSTEIRYLSTTSTSTKYSGPNPEGHYDEENPQSMTKIPQIWRVSLSQNSVKIKKINRPSL